MPRLFARNRYHHVYVYVRNDIRAMNDDNKKTTTFQQQQKIHVVVCNIIVNTVRMCGLCVELTFGISQQTDSLDSFAVGGDAQSSKVERDNSPETITKHIETECVHK